MPKIGILFMKTYYDLSDEEFLRYLRLLVAQLSRLPPYRWQQIAAIAGNPEEFIEIVQSMCNDRLFDWIDDFGNRCCFIDIKDDSLIRLDPMYVRTLKTGIDKRIWK